MADNYEDEEEYYGEEEEGYADEDGMEDYDEDEEAAPVASKSKGGGKDWVKTALMGIAALLFLGGGGYYAATILAPDIVNDFVNNLPFVSQGGDDQFAEAPPADGGVATGDGAAPPPTDVAAVPPPPKPAAPKPKPAAPKPKPMPMPTAAELATEGVPRPAAKPKWKKPAATAWKKPGMTPWQAKQAARKAWLAKKARMANAGRPVATASSWRARQAAARSWRARQAAAQWRSRYAARTYRSRYAAARTYRPASTWHTRYGQPAYTAGTRWIPGQSAYIPWGGGSGAWQRTARPTAYRTAYRAPRGGRYGVQVGSFADSGNAAALAGQLRAQGIPAYVGRGYGVNRVYVGNYANRNQAGAAMRTLRNQGIPAAVTSH